MEQNHQVDLAANAVYERWRVSARDALGHRLSGHGNPWVPPELPEGTINVSDPDSRVMRTQGTPPRQAHNAQTAVNDRQIILAAEVNVDAPDFGHLEPLLNTTLGELREQGVDELPGAVIADAGYWHTAQIQSITERGIEVLIRPDGNMREGKRPGWGEGALRTNAPQAIHRARAQALRTTEDQRRARLRTDQIQPPCRSVMRRGRAAAQSEWRLVTATHNLLKLHSHWIANTA